MDLQERFDEAKTIRGPDLWPAIEERSMIAPLRPARERLVAASAAVVIAVGAGYFVLDAFNTSDRHERPPAIQPGTSTSAGADACKLPIVQPATLPWLEPGAPMPDPLLNPIYKRVTWEGPPATKWEGAYVSVRVLMDGASRGTEPSPALPDGTPGTLRMHQGEWAAIWQSSERYCGSIALYVFLPEMSPDQARNEAIGIARSMAERTNVDVA